MDNKELIGKWVDEMNNQKKKKMERKTLLSLLWKKIKNFQVVIKKIVEKNFLILIVSSIIAIPIFIFFVIVMDNIIRNVTDTDELKSIFQICGVLLVIPYMLMLFYIEYFVSKKKFFSLKVFPIALIIIFGMLNIVMGIRILDSIKMDKIINDDFIFIVYFLDIYTFSFIITKFSYITYLKIMNRIKKLANWVVNNNQESNDILKAKLSFINKVITGFLAIVASILGLILTLNKIL